MSILGNRVLRVEDTRLLTTGGTYVDDVPIEGCVHAVYVRSPIAHALIGGIDAGAARAMPGVLAVLTAADLGVADFPAEAGGPAPMARSALSRVRGNLA